MGTTRLANFADLVVRHLRWGKCMEKSKNKHIPSLGANAVPKVYNKCVATQDQAFSAANCLAK